MDGLVKRDFLHWMEEIERDITSTSRSFTSHLRAFLSDGTSRMRGETSPRT